MPLGWSHAPERNLPDSCLQGVGLAGSIQGSGMKAGVSAFTSNQYLVLCILQVPLPSPSLMSPSLLPSPENKQPDFCLMSEGKLLAMYWSRDAVGLILRDFLLSLLCITSLHPHFQGPLMLSIPVPLWVLWYEAGISVFPTTCLQFSFFGSCKLVFIIHYPPAFQHSKFCCHCFLPHSLCPECCL